MRDEPAYRGLKLGQSAPDFQVLDSTGAPRDLAGLIATGPRVFVFYRGHW
jgi:peroxiredoxin